MCDGKVDGGHRCPTHTRARFHRATPGTVEWDEAAAAYAATPTGRADVERWSAVATADGDSATESALRTALRLGAAHREAYLETRKRIATHRVGLRATGLKNDTYWAAEMLNCLYSADNVVDRGEAVFFEADNTVEIAAARQHIIDLDTAAEKTSDAFRRSHPEIPWVALARTRDRYAHHYDNLNRDIVWNVLIEEFPRIRAALRRYLSV